MFFGVGMNRRETNRTEHGRPRVGISACLLGHPLRFNGGHCGDRLVSQTLSRFFTWIPVCPEVEVGMGVPRETLRLVASEQGPRLMGGDSGRDYTEAMLEYARKRMAYLKDMNLNGFILKKRSPSCGMERVKLYNTKGFPEHKGQGLFARVLMEHFPLLPVEEEGRLNDKTLRENFAERVYGHLRLCRLSAARTRPKDLIRFHTDHKYQLLAHCEKTYRELGRLVAKAGTRPMDAILPAYKELFMDCLKHPGNLRGRSNVLYHFQGFLKDQLNKEDKHELGQAIEAFRRGRVPLAVPVTLFRHHFRKNPNSWVSRQHFWEPCPQEIVQPLPLT